METDVLIIGSGIAGLAFAIKIAERKPNTTICIVTKADGFESNTKYAQGGIAAVMDNITSSFDAHIKDTLKAGKGYCNSETVSLVIKKAPLRLKELIKWGTPFDKTADGNWDLGLEGGHSVARILHHKDQTGWALEKALLHKMAGFKNIFFLTNSFASKLLVKNNSCSGAVFLDKSTNCSYAIQAKITYLATGGSGQVFEKTTNPTIATGDGVAMAYRAGAQVEHMSFYQFHPTALAVNNINPSFLISEAVRGFGAYLINAKGERFVFNSHTDGELATRDIVSDAIFKELLSTGEKHVYLDCRHLDKTLFLAHFPNIVKECLASGIDVFQNLVPVAPAAHYQCGGIAVNKQARTSIKNLYANGECAATGLHGANRLASNSLLEAVVFAHEAACDVAKRITSIFIAKEDFYSFQEKNKIGNDETIKTTNYKKELQHWMYQYYLHKCLGQEISSVLEEITKIQRKIEKSFIHYNHNIPAIELINMSCIATLITKFQVNG
jgi:L-aspartate oxidase